MSVVLRPAAAADIEEAAAWYDRRRTGLGDEFLAAVGAGIAAIDADPARNPVLFRDVRRHLLTRFPYAIYYRLYAEQIVVVACMHGRRAPLHWRGRAL